MFIYMDSDKDGMLSYHDFVALKEWTHNGTADAESLYSYQSTTDSKNDPFAAMSREVR